MARKRGLFDFAVFVVVGGGSPFESLERPIDSLSLSLALLFSLFFSLSPFAVQICRSPNVCVCVCCLFFLLPGLRTQDTKDLREFLFARAN